MSTWQGNTLRSLLDDAVEETPVSIGDVARSFGEPVAMLVADLTDVSRLSEGNREVHKQRDLAHTSGACPRAKTIKLMDLVHNCFSIACHSEGFAVQFLREMHAMLAVMQDASAPAAWVFAQRIFARACTRLAAAAGCIAVTTDDHRDAHHRLRRILVAVRQRVAGKAKLVEP